jgi:hypothetical protein
MRSIDDVKTITIDERTYEAARAGLRPAQMTIDKLCFVICSDETLMVTEIDPVARLDPAERTQLSTLLGKAQIGSRPFDLLKSSEPPRHE